MFTSVILLCSALAGDCTVEHANVLVNDEKMCHYVSVQRMEWWLTATEEQNPRQYQPVKWVCIDWSKKQGVQA